MSRLLTRSRRILRPRPVPDRLHSTFRADGGLTKQQQGQALCELGRGVWQHYGVPALEFEADQEHVAISPVLAGCFPNVAGVGKFEVWLWGTMGVGATARCICVAGAGQRPFVYFDPLGRPRISWEDNASAIDYAFVDYTVTADVERVYRFVVEYKGDQSGDEVIVKFYEGNELKGTATETTGWHATDNGTACGYLGRNLANWGYAGKMSNVLFFNDHLTEAEADALLADPRRWKWDDVGGKRVDGSLVNEGTGNEIAFLGGATGTISGAGWSSVTHLGNRWTNAAGDGDSFAGGRHFLSVPERKHMTLGSFGAIGTSDFTVGLLLTDFVEGVSAVEWVRGYDLYLEWQTPDEVLGLIGSGGSALSKSLTGLVIPGTDKWILAAVSRLGDTLRVAWIDETNGAQEATAAGASGIDIALANGVSIGGADGGGSRFPPEGTFSVIRPIFTLAGSTLNDLVRLRDQLRRSYGAW